MVLSSPASEGLLETGRERPRTGSLFLGGRRLQSGQLPGSLHTFDASVSICPPTNTGQVFLCARHHCVLAQESTPAPFAKHRRSLGKQLKKRFMCKKHPPADLEGSPDVSWAGPPVGSPHRPPGDKLPPGGRRLCLVPVCPQHPASGLAPGRVDSRAPRCTERMTAGL